MVLNMKVGESEEIKVEWDEEDLKPAKGSLTDLWNGLRGLIGLGSNEKEGKIRLEEGSDTEVESGNGETDTLIIRRGEDGSSSTPIKPYGTIDSSTSSPSPSARVAAKDQNKSHWNSLGFQGPSPEPTSTIWQTLSFSWIEEIFKIGYKKDLKETDVWALNPSCRSKRLSEAWEGLGEGSVLWKLWKANSL